MIKFSTKGGDLGLQNFVPYHSNLWMNITPRSYSVPSLLQCENTIGGLLPRHRIPKNRRRRLPILKLGGQYVRNYLRQLLRDTPTILTNDERSRHFRGRGEFSKSISYGIIGRPGIMPQTNISPINNHPLTDHAREDASCSAVSFPFRS